MLIDGLKNASVEVKSAAVYTLSSVISRGLAVISMPIFTRIMSPSDMGIVNLYTSWYSIVSIVSTLALTSGGYSLAMKEFGNERDEYESSVLTLSSLMALIIGGGLVASSPWVSHFIGLSPRLILLMAFGLLVMPAWDFWTLRQRYEYKYKLAFFLSVGSAVLATIASVGAVLIVSSNSQLAFSLAEARLSANYIVVYGLSAVLWVLLIIRGKTFYNSKYWRFSLSLSLPLIGHSVASQVLSVSDRVMISAMVGDAETGIYGVLYSASSISLFFWSAINSSFIPYLFRNIDSEGHEGIRKTSALLLALFALISVLISWFGPEIIRVLATDEYLSAVSLMPPIAAGVFLTAISNMYSNILVYYRQTTYIMFASMIAAAVNVLLNLVFIPLFGFYAAAYTTLASYIVLAISQWAWARKACRERGRKTTVYEDDRLALLSIGTLIATMCGIALYQVASVRYLACLVLFILIVLALVKIRKNKNQ
ncbi:Polysaccharide biosynthesis protein [Collinsella intestinalis]|nr:Polysaccharide biosynthesis protein [Collinsella intestinalis]